jgi:hypothetical protein
MPSTHRNPHSTTIKDKIKLTIIINKLGTSVFKRDTNMFFIATKADKARIKRPIRNTLVRVVPNV